MTDRRRKKKPVYDLYFNGAIPDTGLVNGQVLRTRGDGLSAWPHQRGELNVVELDGTLSVVDNALAFTAQATPAWGDLGVYSQAITRELGKGLLGVVNVGSTATNILPISWQTAASLALNSNDSQFFFGPGSGLNARIGTATAVVAIYTADTDYNIGLILGGYDVNGQPWYAGQNPSSYLYGAAWYVKGGSFSTRTLLWRTKLNNTATLYAALSNFDAVGTLQNFRVVSGLSAVLQPAALSTFTAANGTSLDAITPEVGGLWTEQNGNWNIQGNRATVAQVGGFEVATQNADIADAVIDCIVNTTDATNPAGITLRYSAISAFWRLVIDADDDVFQLVELSPGSTLRASAGVTIDPNTDYDIRAIADGTTIDGFLNGGTKITYGSATFNQTETEFGLFASVGATSYDNFAVYPRTSSVYDGVFDNV